MFAQINSISDAAFARAERDWLTPPEESAPAFECDCCGEGLFFDDRYYLVGGLRYCESCIIDARYSVRESDFKEAI